MEVRILFCLCAKNCRKGQGRRSGICSGTTMSGRPNADQAGGSGGVSLEKIDKIEANSCILGTFGCILTMNLGVNTCTG